MSVFTTFEAVYTIFEISLCVWLFCRTYPARQHFAVRAVLSIGGAAALYLSGAMFGSTMLTSDWWSSTFYFSQLCAFVGLLILYVALVMVCYDISVWNALFCCTAGYTVQNLASGLHGFVMILCGLAGVAVEPSSSGIVTENHIIAGMSLVATSLAVISVSYVLYIRPVARSGLKEVEDHTMLVAVIAVVMFEMAFDLVNKGLSNPISSGSAQELPPLFLIVLKVTHLATCLLVLFMQHEMLYSKRLQLDRVAIERMAQDQRHQYETSRMSIEAINMRCHDIRHQIQSLGAAWQISQETLEELAREVDVYDSAVKTGNDALDVILTEKHLICQRERITLSCIADGKSIQFIKPADLYALFGNALDNAIEAVRAVPRQDKWSISLMVRRSGDMASIHVENYFAGSIGFKDGMPLTTKEDGRPHGYGMKSMRMMAERYGGTLTCRTQDDIFHLNILIPIPVAPNDSDGRSAP